jgi:hypothetical protein
MPAGVLRPPPPPSPSPTPPHPKTHLDLADNLLHQLSRHLVDAAAVLVPARTVGHRGTTTRRQAACLKGHWLPPINIPGVLLLSVYITVGTASCTCRMALWTSWEADFRLCIDTCCLEADVTQQQSHTTPYTDPSRLLLLLASIALLPGSTTTVLDPNPCPIQSCGSPLAWTTGGRRPRYSHADPHSLGPQVAGAQEVLVLDVDEPLRAPDVVDVGAVDAGVNALQAGAGPQAQ